jgi:hypothetical protein
MISDWILGLFLGIGLSASAGFKVFIPLFALSIAGYFDIIPINDNWQWLSHPITFILLGVATLVELLAYFIPFVDNLLDTITLPLATLAGTLIIVATSSDLSPAVTWALAIIAGGGTAATVKSMTTTTRATSTATTAGIANPVIAGAEITTASVLSLVSITAPILGIIFVGIILFSIRKFYLFLFKRKPKK